MVNDPVSVYRVYFTDLGGGQAYGTVNAILVDDNDTNDMSGAVSANPEIQLTFDYDNNIQGGRTPGTDANITVVAAGLELAQPVVATGVIERSIANVVQLTAPEQRTYLNPV